MRSRTAPTATACSRTRRWRPRRARELADRHCDGRLALIQEGGYGRSYSALCMHATLEGVLATGPLLEDPMGYLPDDETRGDAGIAAARGSMRRYWPI